MTIHIRKKTGDLDWDIRSRWFFTGWHLYWIAPRKHGQSRDDNRETVWMATFRELSHLDAYISTFEKPKSELDRLQSHTIAQFANDEIDEAEFVETAMVYSMTREQCDEVIANKREEEGRHND